MRETAAVMNPLKILVRQYARHEIDHATFLRRLDEQDLEVAEDVDADREGVDASLARTHAAMRRIGRL